MPRPTTHSVARGVALICIGAVVLIWISLLLASAFWFLSYHLPDGWLTHDFRSLYLAATSLVLSVYVVTQPWTRWEI